MFAVIFDLEGQLDCTLHETKAGADLEAARLSEKYAAERASYSASVAVQEVRPPVPYGEAPAMLAALREIRGLATWYSAKAKGEIYTRASAILARIDGTPTAQPADPIPASYGIAAAPFAVFQIDAGTLTIERHDGPSPVRWAVDAARFAAAMQALTEGEG